MTPDEHIALILRIQEETARKMEETARRMDRLDERDRALAERHQALAQTVELLTAEGRALDGRIDRLLANSERDAENIRALARIAEIHERRIGRLEGTE